ncbi:MAG: deoxyribodipyrimidine photo-lyase [Ferruginibacter sp.]
MKKEINICWFRRDLRLKDNAALYHALKSDFPVLPVFIFDTLILDKLEHRSDARVDFIYRTLMGMQEELVNMGSSLHVLNASPAGAFRELLGLYNIRNVFTNTDYEPYATERDKEIATLLQQHGATFLSYKDHVILDHTEVLKDDGLPYTVYTPYSKKWKTILTDFHLKAYPTEKYYQNFLQQTPVVLPSLQDLGFKKTTFTFPPRVIKEEIITHYGVQRDYPGIRGTSHLGLHLRFGTLSVRLLAKYAAAHSAVFLNELIWRDFYQGILANFPQVGKGRSFKPAYDHIKWRNDEAEFEKWCRGETGYPIVDAGMRELNETGFMHNRVRMITASFLCKHLLIDWRWGEAYFAAKLLDYDLAANNGGWQWAAGSGCDAAPYFRIFNPYLQTKKFDASLEYIRKWVPEFEEFSYPKPIVDHVFARERCLKVYKEGLNEYRV